MSTAVESKDAFLSFLNESKGALVVAHFWADWAPQCQQMEAVLAELAKTYPAVRFAKVEAEAVPELSERFSITAVPTIVLFKLGKEVARVNGANAPEVTAKVGQFAALATVATPVVDDGKALEAKLTKLINAAPVMLFMKGTADEPECGFSRKMVALLREIDAEFSTFNILADDQVRQGLKTFSNWKTFPQLYIKGELIGGLDVAKELNESGELKAMLPQPLSQDELNAKLKALINQSKIMLFMKGTPEAPRCGFSRTMVGLLQEEGVEFGHYDILGDNEVRSGLKTYSNWPTFPQLYANGELIGGLDIAKELKEAGELASTLNE
eukprot:TRINITY_DN10758_c0_g1_i3.p2 TRINITY_DN10758_c0_g1~~TRINITY_DN10758_c0_g1_i3.p2  ORF type:complete len:325 (+),score=109.64 TRINITY_DN10758_c0_g1_i3:44-1018(+)